MQDLHSKINAGSHPPNGVALAQEVADRLLPAEGDVLALVVHHQQVEARPWW